MKQGMKMLGLALLAVLSIMAVIAVGAQAAGQLRIEGKVLAESEEAELEGTGGKSKLLVPGLGLTVECESSLLKVTTSNWLTFAKLIHGTHHQVSHGCVIVGAKNCTIYPTEEDLTNKTNAGLLLSISLQKLILLSNPTRHYLVFEPISIPGFLKWFFLGGVFCTLPEEIEVTGETAVKFANATTEEVEHGMEDITATEEAELGVEGLSFNEEPAEIDGGSSKVKLVGKFAGKKYSLN
jgi:hypothetical protein